MKWLILVLVIQFCIRISKSAASLNGGITFDLALIDSSHIQFTITYRSSGWVGFGYGTCMCSNDMFVIQASGGAGTISDMTMNGHNYPNMDAVNDYTLSTSTSGSTNTYTVTRLLSDGDSGDYQFKNGTTYIVYAWGSGSMSNHGSNYGSFSFNLVINSGTSSGGSSSGGSGSSSSGSSGSSSSGSTGSSSSGDAGSSSGGSSGSTSNSGSGNNSNGNSGGSSNSGGSCGSCSFGSSSINTGGGIVTIDDSKIKCTCFSI